MKKTPHVIDIELDEPTRMTPALSQVDRLLKQSLLETQSLQVVRHLLLRDQTDKAQMNGHNKLLAAATYRLEQTGEDTLPKKRKTKKRKLVAGRDSKENRIEAVRRYLEQHPGADTQTIGAGLGWRPAQVPKFAREIAIRKKGAHRKPAHWFLKGQKPQPAINGVPLKDRQPRTQRQEQIRLFLDKHPEAYTRDVAKALRLKPNSSFVKVLRTIAKPVRQTKGTQPIQWVLSA